MPEASGIGKRTGNVSVVILAGGYSLRMGYPKLLLPFNHSLTFIEQIVKAFRLVTDNIVLVINEEVYKKFEVFFSARLPDVTMVLNPNPECGRTYSIQLGLKKIDTNRVFIHNSDNPFVNEALLKEMMLAATDNGYVSMRVNDRGGHPILLCGATIEKVDKAETERSLKEILSGENRTDIQTDDESILLDIDTPESYQKFFYMNLIYFERNEFITKKKGHK